MSEVTLNTQWSIPFKTFCSEILKYQMQKKHDFRTVFYPSGLLIWPLAMSDEKKSEKCINSNLQNFVEIAYVFGRSR